MGKDTGNLYIKCISSNIESNSCNIQDIWLFDSLTQDNNHFTYASTTPTYSDNGLTLNSNGTLNYSLPDKYSIEFDVTNRPNVPNYEWADGFLVENFKIVVWQNNGVVYRGDTELSNSVKSYATNDKVKFEYDSSTLTLKYYLNDVLKYTASNISQTNIFKLLKTGNYRVTIKDLKIKEL